MGSLFSKPKEVKKAPQAQSKPKVQVNESEMVLAKLKMQIDRMETRVKKLNKDDQTLDGKIRSMVSVKKKEEAYFYLKQKKTVKESITTTNKRLEFVQKQIDNMESAIDDAKFTDIVRDSNRAVEKLAKEIDLEEIRIAKELQQEGKMRREELESMLDDDDVDDQEIKAELDKMEQEMVEEEFSKETSKPVKHDSQERSKNKEQEKHRADENRGQLLAN